MSQSYISGLVALRLHCYSMSMQTDIRTRAALGP